MTMQAHSLLGVAPDASVTEVRAAFRRLALEHHPDRNLGDPLATQRFERILRAYRQALAVARGAAAPKEAPVGPRPDRYSCGQCGDHFPFPEQCPRCGVALWDGSAGPAVPETPAPVAAMIRRLEARPEVPEIDWEERLPVPGLLIAGCLAMAALTFQLGPIGPAMLLVGFAGYVTALEAHRRVTVPA